MGEGLILIVEDEQLLAENLRLCLQRFGYQVVATVSSGEEAIRVAQRTKPGLVLMDIVLEDDMDGVEAADIIRSLLGIPVLYLTSRDDPDTLARAKVTGPYGYLLKPFTERNLRITVEMALYTAKMEKRLRENEERYRAVVETQTELISRNLLDGTLTFVNEAYCRYFGKRREDLIGTSFMPMIPVEDHEAVKRRFASLTRERPFFTHEHRVIRPDGEIRWHQWTRQAIYDHNGLFVEFQAVGRDITDLKRAEELLHERTKALEASNKSLDEFAHVAAHDLREPLLAVSANLQVLQRICKDRPCEDAERLIHRSIEAISRMDGLVRGLLEYAVIGNNDRPFEQTDVNSVLEAASSNLHVAVTESGASISCDALPVVKADPYQMIQVFQNLLANAIKYRGERTPEIHIGFEAKGGEFEFHVRDNGIGIDAGAHERIFGMFQRLHRSSDGPGTGIGLASCKKIVERHGGRIWVESNPVEGSTFFFTLPDRGD